MEDTWTNRDLPVLRAAVELYEQTGSIAAYEIEQALGFDTETVQRALRALYTKPYFDEGIDAWGADDQIIFVGRPTSEALHIAGQWPTPENLLERLISAFQAAGENQAIDERDRRKFKDSAEFLRSSASPVVIRAIGGLGGKIVS